MGSRDFEAQWDFNGAGVVLLVDKPKGWTSFDVVHRVRSLFGVRKIGHAGTLDPNATGLLILCTGPKTRSVDSFMVHDKEYVGTMEMGVRTESFDSEGKTIATAALTGVTQDRLHEAAAQLVGPQMQTPPMFSAVKVKGKPLYKYARKGRTVDRTPRSVEVFQFGLTAIRLPMVDFFVQCSKGTYIRSLVEEFGLRIGCGATLRELRRTRSGPYRVEDAWTVGDLEILASRLPDARSTPS